MRCAGLLLAVLVLASAFATPIGVTRVDPQSMYAGLTASVLSTGRPSQYSEHLLIRLGLSARFAQEPEAAVTSSRSGIGIATKEEDK